jgi:hypothetical protein
VPAVAFVKDTSEAVNPVTASEKVNVRVIAELLVGPEAGDEVIATVGAALSYVIDHGVEAMLPFDAESIAELAATLADTADAVGVIASV